MNAHACHRCGYELTGLDASGSCPECGQPYDLTSKYRGVYRPDSRRSDLWKAFGLAGAALMVLVCGGGLSLLARRPMGVIVTAVFIASVPAMGAVVYWWVDHQERKGEGPEA